MYCSECGNKLPDGAKFCSNCGTQQEVIPKIDKIESMPKKVYNRKKLKPLYFIVSIAVVFILFFIILDKKTKVKNDNLSKIENSDVERGSGNGDLKDNTLANRLSKAVKGSGISNSNDVFLNEGEIEVTFIDVGQGDCILITDNSQAMLIDAGNHDSYKVIEETVHSKGVNKVDILVNTHPDPDHIGSEILLLAEFDIPVVYMPPVDRMSTDLGTVESVIGKRGIEVVNPVCGQPIPFGNADYTVYCTNNIEYDDTNSYSLIVKAVNGEDSFLFTGDATGEEVDKILADGYDLSANIMQAANHGDGKEGCNSENFIKSVNPNSFVISGGDGKKLPSEETIELADALGLDVYRTDLQGTITFVSSGSGITNNH